MILRKIVAFLLLFVMIFCIAKNSALYTFYQLNTNAFTALFCENKAKPLLKCNGKCQLTKLANEKQEAEKVLISLQKEVFWFYQQGCATAPTDLLTAVELKLLTPPRTNLYTYLYFFIDDKPPQFLS